MKRLAVIPLLVLAVSAGCGGGGTKTTSLQLSGPPSSASCDKRNISSGESSGTCVAGDTRISLVGSTRTLSMEDYDARLLGIQRATHLGGRASVNFAPDSEFVIAKLRITNTGSRPFRFDRAANLAFLLVGGAEYQEVPGAEKESSDSFGAHGAMIAPGKSATGTVVFDPPSDRAKTAGTKGTYLVFRNPEDAGNGFPRVGDRAIGFIRLSP